MFHGLTDVQIIALMIATNLFLRTLHFVLFQLGEKYKWKWSNSALTAINVALTTIAWMGMSLHAPENKNQVDKPT